MKITLLHLWNVCVGRQEGHSGLNGCAGYHRAVSGNIKFLCRQAHKYVSILKQTQSLQRYISAQLHIKSQRACLWKQEAACLLCCGCKKKTTLVLLLLLFTNSPLPSHKRTYVSVYVSLRKQKWWGMQTCLLFTEAGIVTVVHTKLTTQHPN